MSPGRIGYLGLGSNLGEREEHLRGALLGLREHGVEVRAISSVYETEPVGEITDQPDFLNAAARVETELGPHDLLDLCKAIEAEHGRLFGAPRHGPRPLDIDLLLLGEIELRDERLTLPHPQVASRRFVLEPLLELDPELKLPDSARLADALAKLPPQPRVERHAGPESIAGSGLTSPTQRG
jgi:2-amino-4-hydroxy-6-hydroxymethyldihydropteridine diphosphokinase